MSVKRTKQGVGLVLSGGGGKGAYEIGIWKALDEYGVTPNIVAISGTSVGGLNSAPCLHKGISTWLLMCGAPFPPSSYDIERIACISKFFGCGSSLTCRNKIFWFCAVSPSVDYETLCRSGCSE